MENSNSDQEERSFGRQLGLMYKRWVLDCIPNLGYAISLDFSHRPELYKRVDFSTAESLTNMQSRYGYAPNFPNKETRFMLMKPLFGLSDGHTNGNDGSAFQTARLPVLAASAGYAENAQPTAFPMHRERVRSAIVPLRRLIEDLEGASLDQTDIRTGELFETSASILRDQHVAMVFGINGPIDPEWPLNSSNSEGAKLVEKITTQLPDMPYSVISRDKFVGIQRIAEKGFLSVYGILGFDIEMEDELLDQVNAQLYAWGSDLKLIGGARPQ